jgi:hypothetical protein
VGRVRSDGAFEIDRTYGKWSVKVRDDGDIEFSQAHEGTARSHVRRRLARGLEVIVTRVVSALSHKPNHFSIMNYPYQLEGLPTIGTDDDTRSNARSSRKFWCIRSLSRTVAPTAMFFPSSKMAGSWRA